MENVNAIFEEFSMLFASNSRAEEGLPRRRHVPTERLDFTVASLGAVDEYLLRLHRKHPALLEGQWANAVLWGGAYVGEVIRRTTTTVHQWVDLEVWIAANPDHADMLSPQSLTLPAVLSPGHGGFTLPVTKVAKCIVNGPIDAVSYYVRVWLRAYP